MPRINQLKESMDESFGEGAFIQGSDRKSLDIKRVPTSLIELDIAMGGGLPIGRTTMIWGPRSSGKSTLCELMIASAQQHCRKCWGPIMDCKCPVDEGDEDNSPTTLWCDVEGTYTASHASQLGIDPTNMLISIPGFGEEAVKMVQDSVVSGLCDFIVVDSLAMMSPKKEVERDLMVSPNMIGEQARLITTFLRKLQMSMNILRRERGESPTVILINQERVKINTFGHAGKQKPGGEAQGFMPSVEVHLKRNTVNFTKDKQQNVTGVSHAETFFKIDKNKVYTPELSGRYRIWVHPDKDHKFGETDEVEKVVKLSIQEGIITKTASKLEFAGINYKTQRAFRESMQEDFGLFSEVRGTLLGGLIWRPAGARAALEKINAAEETDNPYMDTEKISGPEEEQDTKSIENKGSKKLGGNSEKNAKAKT